MVARGAMVGSRILCGLSIILIVARLTATSSAAGGSVGSSSNSWRVTSAALVAPVAAPETIWTGADGLTADGPYVSPHGVTVPTIGCGP